MILLPYLLPDSAPGSSFRPYDFHGWSTVVRLLSIKTEALTSFHSSTRTWISGADRQSGSATAKNENYRSGQAKLFKHHLPTT